MELKIRPILSVLSIGAFLCLALASDLLEESTNTLVQAENCKSRPVVTGNLVIRVKYFDDDNDPIHGAAGTLSITHQVIKDTTNCTYDNTSASIQFHLDANGTYEYTNNPFTHFNDADLFRVEVYIPGGENDNQDWGGFRAVEVANYDRTVIIITKFDPPSLN